MSGGEKVLVPHGVVAEIFLTSNWLIALGDPYEDEHLPEEQRHNCDAMGCGQSHVVGRLSIKEEKEQCT